MILCTNPSINYILDKEYIQDPDSSKLNWSYLCLYSSNISLLKKKIIQLKTQNNYNISKHFWKLLCLNPLAISLIEEMYELKDSNVYHPTFLFWENICSNPAAISIITKEYYKRPYNICWCELCKNTAAQSIIEIEYNKNPNSHHLVWSSLYDNCAAINIIKQELLIPNNYHNYTSCWDSLSNDPTMISIINQEWEQNNNSDKLNWFYLSSNPAAIHIIEAEYLKNPKSLKINWFKLSTNIAAINIFKKCYTIHKNNNNIWYHLLKNPGMISIINSELIHNLSDMDYKAISKNPAIFEYDYDTMKLNKQLINQDLIQWFYHPLRIATFM